MSLSYFKGAMYAALDKAILIVEDEAFIRMVAVDVLSDLGLPLYEASDADEALSVLKEHPEIELLFTDVHMPGQMDGLCLAEHVHKERPNVKLIVTSGKSRLRNAELPDHGVFLPKPYGAHELLKLVERQFQRGQAST